MKRFLILIPIVLALAPLVFGQWGGGSCPPSGPVWSQPNQQQGLRWQRLTEDQWALMDGDRQLGCWSQEGNYYRARIGFDSWGEPTDPPYEPPVKVARKEEKKPEPEKENHLPTGVESDKIHSHEKVTINGEEVDPQLIEGSTGQLTDDSGKAFVTFICSDQEARKKFLERWKTPEFASFKALVHVTTYPPDHFHAKLYQLEKDPKFEPAKGVTIFQGPGREEDGRSAPRIVYGQADVVQSARALRDIDPKYDPTKAKDLTNTPSLPLPNIDLTKLPPAGWVVLGAAMLLLFIRPKKK